MSTPADPISSSNASDIERLQKDIAGYIQKLRLEQSRLSASINSLPVGFVILDFKNNILIKNRAVDTILDLKDLEGNVFLRGDMAYISDKLRASYDLDIKSDECMKTNKAIESGDVVYGTKILRIFIGPIVPTAGEVIGVVIFIEDITEAKVLERAKEEFFSIASHELRTPLTSIRGNASMILEYFKDEIKNTEVKEMLSDIYNASVRLIDLVNDFLNVSRLEQKRIEFKFEDFNICELTKKVTAQIDNLAREKGLQLTCAGSPEGLPMVRADKNRTEETLLNLIGNAIKYTEKGSVTVSLEKLENAFLKVRIADTGRGIAPEQQNLLFRKFQQAGESLLTRDTTKGTGLGLYISKLIVEGMGGTIGLEASEAERGSTFYFTLPIAFSSEKK
jgi:signal transduction histidine kinase